MLLRFCPILPPNLTKMFHVKHFCPIEGRKYTRPHTTRGVRIGGIAQKIGLLGGFRFFSAAEASLGLLRKPLSWHGSGRTTSPGAFKQLRGSASTLRSDL